MNTFCLEINQVEESDQERTIASAHQLGVTTLTGCRKNTLYFFQGNITAEQAHLLGHQLLADPVIESFSVQQAGAPPASNHNQFIDVTLLPGVTDPAAENLVRAAHLLGYKGLEQAATGQRYLIEGELDSGSLNKLASELFANPVIQRFSIDRPISPPFVAYKSADSTVEIIPICDVNDDDLQQISIERRLALNLEEMQAIRSYYQREERNPSDVELETLAQTWSEHCVHKTFRATIQYEGPSSADPNSPAKSQQVNGLLKAYIRAATEKVDRPWVHSAFVDNAGIIAFDDQFDLAFKVETHNHPSALEPFGGANTGVGGVIRDVIGVSARPIANTDILCFGPPDLPEELLPEGVLHPRRIADGVVHGIEDYGNKMGIPTVNGAIYYHPGYTANPLVYCGCLGILPRGSHRTTAEPGDLIVAIGGRTGRDGLRGATFSSMEMDVSTGEIAGSAVQIGHPIHEKQVLEVILKARDEALYTAITDCGAGGFSSAVGEMGEHLGATVQLAHAPLKYPGLRPWEIWLSEAQERMVLAVPPDKWPRLQQICAGQDVEGVCIGRFEDTGRLRLFYGDSEVGELSMDFLHNGLPARHMDAFWTPPSIQTMATPEADAQTLLSLLAHPNIRSKEDVVRRYDHEIQGGTVVKPFTGIGNQGPSDAAVIVPLDTQLKSGGPTEKGVALSNGICPAIGEIDPYAMAWAAIDEAIRNVVAVGADPDQIAILDNFCWGNPNLPDRLGSLVRCAQGCYDAAVTYNTPFISGKDSLNNEYTGADLQKHAIPGTLLISATGIVPDIAQTVSMDLKPDADLLYIIGDTGPELGGSHFGLVNDWPDSTIPTPVHNAPFHFQTLHEAIKSGLVRACHDLSEGGLAVALAEMVLAGGIGVNISLSAVPTNNQSLTNTEILFSESLSRFLVQVKNENAAEFEARLSQANVPFGKIGRTGGTTLTINDQQNNPLFTYSIAQLEHSWRGHIQPRPNQPTSGVLDGHQPNQPAVFPATINQSTKLPNHSIAHSSPPILILHANGTNRDREAALACQMAGGEPEIVHVNQLLAKERRLLDYQMLVVPGGFSYGDDLGAGTLWALDLQQRFNEELAKFVESGKPVLGICNGFQALVKSGLLPGGEISGQKRSVTLADNESGRFECRWVYLRPNPNSTSIFTKGIDTLIYCPVAHGEGRLMVDGEKTADQLESKRLIALTYVNSQNDSDGYPVNPNGSVLNIAGLSNPAGNVLGLMPHPEDHIFNWQHPRHHRGEGGMSGLRLFENGIKYIK